jgi:hypothetical protein
MNIGIYEGFKRLLLAGRKYIIYVWNKCASSYVDLKSLQDCRNLQKLYDFGYYKLIRGT